MFGQIQSPGYPDSYPSDSRVTWNITVPEGFRIKLYFMHFNLESSYLCEYDYVKVRPLIFLNWARMSTGNSAGSQGSLDELDAVLTPILADTRGYNMMNEGVSGMLGTG